MKKAKNGKIVSLMVVLTLQLLNYAKCGVINNNCLLKLIFTTKMIQTQTTNQAKIAHVLVCMFPYTKLLFRKFFSHSIRQLINIPNSGGNEDKLMKINQL